MRTAYLGTSDFAATVLRRLAASADAPGLVVTPPDSRQGRGRKLEPPPVAEAARELGLELHQTASVNDPDSRRELNELEPEAVVVCAFGQLIKEPLLSEHELLNVHPSLLPRWRGAAPIERAIMAGDEVTGTTIMRVTAGLDSGPIAVAERSPIGSEDYFDDVSARLAELSGELLIRALELKRTGAISFTEQDELKATYAEKVTAEERHLDPSKSAAELAWTVRALNPHIGTYLELEGGERLGVRRARAAEGGPGKGRIAEGDGVLLLGTADAALALEQLQPPGKRAMSVPEFVRGNPVPLARGLMLGYIGHMAAERADGGLGGKADAPEASEGALKRPECPGCGEPWLRPAQLPGRFVCVYCLRRFELVSQCPNCGEHQTISRMSRTEDMKCQHCGDSMLRSI